VEKLGDKQGSSVLNYGLLILLLTHILIHAAGNMRSTLFPVLKNEFTLTNQQIALIVAIPTLSQTLVTIPVGWLSDKFGSKKLIALSIVMAASGAFIGSISTGPWMYILASTLLTLTSTVYHPPTQSYVSGMTGERDRARYLGVWNAGGTLGVSLGPLSVSVLVGFMSFQWRHIYGFWVIPIILGLLALHFVKDSTPEEREARVYADEENSKVTKLLNVSMLVFLASTTVRMFGGGLTSGFLSIWLVDELGWSLSDIGIMFGGASLLGFFAAPIGGVMASRFGDKRWLTFTMFASCTCFLMAILLKGFWPFMVFYLGQRIFNILGMAANGSITARLSPPRQRGMGFALSSLPMSVATSIAAWIAAIMVDSYGLYSIFPVAAVVYFIGWIVFRFGVRVD
jgi:MFS family permease